MARAAVARYAPPGGFDFRYDPAPLPGEDFGRLYWRLSERPLKVQFDIHYADGREPFRSMLTTNTSPYFAPDVVECVGQDWFVYVGAHQVDPVVGVLAEGVVDYCPTRKVT